MTLNPFEQQAHLGLDLFGSTAFSPGTAAPSGLLRIPMKEDPADADDEPQDQPSLSFQRSDGLLEPPAEVNPARAGEGSAASNPLPVARNFRLIGDRGLASGWKRRAQDNLAAIRLLRLIEREDRPATPDEQTALIKFCAFSSTELAQGVFRRPGETFRDAWAEIGTELEALVDCAELSGLRRATQYAHFTPEYLIRVLWRTVTGFGFAGGQVLEPGCGSGLFIALAPETVAPNCDFHGIETDPVTARIARLLYPESWIEQADFTKAKLTGSYDLAIGNPPFSDRTVRLPREEGPAGLSLHDAFLLRSIHHLRPGGIGAFVVSRWMMDKIDITARDAIAKQADLIRAIRLPQGAMRADAGTDVVVDLLFFRKRGGDLDFPTNWVETGEALAAEDGEPACQVNEYFLNHPECVLGRHARTSSAYGMVYTCAGDTGAGLRTALDAVIASLPRDIHEPIPSRFHRAGTKARAVFTGRAAEGAAIREGSYLVMENRLHQVVNGIATEIAIKRGKGEGIPKQHAHVIDALIPVRDAVRAVLRAQANDQPFKPAQIKLRQTYTRFVRSYGPINRTQVVSVTDEDTGEVREIVRRPNLAIFADDPDVWLVASIETYDPDTGRATHGPIFDRQVIKPPAAPVIVSAADALSVCLHETGRADPDHIAELLGCDRGEVEHALAGMIYLDPASNTWETADAYLSGKVRDKLARAEAAAAGDPRFMRNVDALRAAQPVDLKPSEITARLGAPWLPSAVIDRFTFEIIGVETRVRHTAAIGHWSVAHHDFSGKGDCRTVWGTERRHAGELLDDALNSSIPQIWDTWTENGQERRELNAEATEAAKEKLAAIKTAFQTWVWTDPDRADTLAAIYNTQFNNLVTRRFDGGHLTLPGASAVIDFYPTQKRVVWRIIASGGTYIAHAVGAGKTFSMAAAVMEQKRLGLIRKAMMVVPGHCLAQASREFLQLYPTASILVADETNFAKARRQRFLARAATAAWDCIIITHSAFRFIPVSIAFEREMILDQIAVFDDLLGNVDGEDRIARKRIEKIKEGFEAKLEALGTDKDDLLTIGEMGIDQIIVDEAQEFRKLTFPTNMGTLKGVDPNGSQRAWDLYVKTRFIETINPGRALVMASGTPITNTMGELFTLQRFFAPDLLGARGIHTFDAWAANFGETRTELELQPSGTYKPVTRFSEFVNVPELIDIFRHFADVMLKDDLRAYLRLPRIAGGRRQLVTAAPTPAFRCYQRILDQRIKAIEDRRGRPQKGDDILLSVITDGRHAAIDLRLVAEGLANDPRSKLNLLIDQVEAIYHRTRDAVYEDAPGVPYEITGGGQLIFSDLGTLNVEASRGFSAYRWIKTELVRRGIPAAEIAFMQSYKKAAQKQALFADFNAGRVRILIGSTQTMGTGVNVQKRLVALHHLDVPWLPSDIEQREGRIERQGNQNQEIGIFAYATLTSMDATMWQNNERKQRFIEAALSGDRSIRRLEDAGSQSNQFALAKAIASGDQRLMQKAGLEAEIGRLARLRSAHLDGQLMIQRTIADAEHSIGSARRRIGWVDQDLTRRETTRGEAFVMTLSGRRYTERKEAGSALLRTIMELAWEDRSDVIGRIGGFDISIKVARDRKMRIATSSIVLHRTGAVQLIDLPDEPSALGVIARLESALDRFERDRAEWEELLEASSRRLADYRPRLGQGFELQGELDLKQAELTRLEADLAAIAKGEAAGTAAPIDPTMEFARQFGVTIKLRQRDDEVALDSCGDTPDDNAGDGDGGAGDEAEAAREAA